MNKLVLTAAGVAVAAAVTVPAVIGLTATPSFAQPIPVRVPQHAATVTFDDHGHAVVSTPTSARSTPGSTVSPTAVPTRRRPSTEPGDDRGRTMEPGDDRGRTTEPGDDRGRSRSTTASTSTAPTSAGDDRSGRGGSGSGSSGSGSSGSGTSGSGRSGSDDGSGHDAGDDSGHHGSDG